MSAPFPKCPFNQSQIGLLLQRFDWSASSLGHPDTWPQSLCNYVSLMLESKFPMFLAWGNDLGLLYNDAYIEIMGAKHPSGLGRPLQETWQEVWHEVGDIIGAAFGGTSSYFENLPLTIHRNGYDEATWFTFSYSPLRDESGEVAGIFCACSETTSQMLVEINRQQETDRLKALFQQAPGYIAILSEPDHVFELVNDAYYKLVGHRDLIGKPVLEALPELAGQGYQELLDNVVRSRQPFVGRGQSAMLRRDGGDALEQRFLDFVQQPIFDSAGNVTGIFVEGSDVTEAVNAAAAVRDSEARLRQLANNIPHLAWMANPDGHIHWYNDRWYAYTGASIETVGGWGWSALIDPAHAAGAIQAWRQALASGEHWEATFPLRSATGEWRMFASQATPLRDEMGKIVQWFGTNTDITDQLSAQEEITKASQRKDEFLAMLAHELRNPLAPINSAADLLTSVQLDAAQVNSTARIISRQVNHITKLVDDLLDVSRVTRGLVTLRLAVVDVNQLLGDAIEQVQAAAEAKHHRLIFREHELPVFVQGDPTRLVQVFANVLNNAVRYTPPNGIITAQVTVVDGKARVAVGDNGIGIVPTLLPHIFDLFTQGERSPDRSQGGLGMGLALVKSLVELHEGKVDASSAGLGQGAEFVIELPRVATASETFSQVPAGTSENVVAHARHLMVVDDNEDAAEMLSMLLEAAGHTVQVAHHGNEALRVAKETSPAMFFLDIGLPDMDGYELAKRLRQLDKTGDAVLVAITGYGQPEDRDKALRSGFNYHLVKPVNLEAVLEIIETLPQDN
jgi:PAS domain S-box-containing protein